MTNPPKKKGTAGETELRSLIVAFIVAAYRYIDAGTAERAVERMPASAGYDLRVLGADGHRVEVLATRPDRGQWLVTLRLQDFLDLWNAGQYPPDLHIEVKRYARMIWHTIFTGKFGDGR